MYRRLLTSAKNGRSVRRVCRLPVSGQGAWNRSSLEPCLTIIQSTLMSKLTGTHSEVSAIDFTTLTTVPGTVKVHGAPIQILDLRKFHQRLADLIPNGISWNYRGCQRWPR